jgi:site-specific recombinase XerD
MNYIKQFINQYSSQKTQVAYQKDMEDLKLQVGKKFPFDVSQSDLSTFKDTLMEQGSSSSTINRKFSAIKAFYKWAISETLISKNPAEYIKLPKITVEKPTLALSDKEAKNLLKLTKTNDFKDLSANLQFTLMLQLGLRRIELATLKFKDIVKERDHNLMRIRGKGGKIRFVPITESVLHTIEQFRLYYKDITKRSLYDEDYIIQSVKSQKNKQPICTSTIYRNVCKYCKKLGIKVNITPHSCRATAISHLLDKKVPIRDVADYAGHSSVNTTSIYDKKRQGYNNSPAYKIEY